MTKPVASYPYDEECTPEKPVPAHGSGVCATDGAFMEGVSLSESIFQAEPGQSLLVTGAGAVARGAIEAGVGFVSTYPGSPITEVFDLLQSPQNPCPPICRLSLNEHLAFHQASGYCLAGGRAMVTMKHVGFNVAADPAHYAGYLGAKGGMVVAVGTDPGALCSTGEYDFRFYALHTHLPLLEPTSAQEALDLTRQAFAWSEEDRLPYVIALPAGLCYGIEDAIAGNVEIFNRNLKFEPSPDYTNVGARAVLNHRRLLERVEQAASKAGRRNLFKSYGNGREAFIITSGSHLQRTLEAVNMLGLEKRVTVACSSLTYPFPDNLLQHLLKTTSNILFIEDLGGFLETSLSRVLLNVGRPLTVHGKDLFPAFGYLDLEKILAGLSKFFQLPERRQFQGIDVPEREGTFCPGCPYRPFFHVLMEKLGPDGVLGGDIGCSSLPPHFSSWLTCMNSGTSMASGVSMAIGTSQPVVSLIGDSALQHSGLQTLMECAAHDSNQICFILFNHWTAMTGHQDTVFTPMSIDGRRTQHLDLEPMLRGIGVKSIDRVDPFHMNAFRKLLKRLFQEKGFRVVLVEHECTLQARRRPSGKIWTETVHLEPERCQECYQCYEAFSCPAIIKNSTGLLEIDETLCAQCGVCTQICPNGALKKTSRMRVP